MMGVGCWVLMMCGIECWVLDVDDVWIYNELYGNH